ncbi:MAG: hypothetical protein ACYC3I_10645 [Gemmataceae bacterium]
MNRKRMSLVLTLTTAVVAAALGWLLPLSKNSQAAPVPSSEASFKGKLLLVNTINAEHFLLEKVQLQKIGERSWLVGKGAAENKRDGWYKGRTVRLQMEPIVSITEFDDIKDANKALEQGAGSFIPAAGIAISGTGSPAPAPLAPLPSTPPAPGLPPATAR